MSCNYDKRIHTERKYKLKEKEVGSGEGTDRTKTKRCIKGMYLIWQIISPLVAKNDGWSNLEKNSTYYNTYNIF